MTAFGPNKGGTTGAAGADGRDAGWNYKFSTSTSGDPGSGKLLLNNSTIASATQLNVSISDDDSNSLGQVINAWFFNKTETVGDVIVKKVGSSTAFICFRVTGTGSGGSPFTHFAFAGTVVESSGTFSNNDETMISFTPSGLVQIPSGGSASAPGLPVSGDANTGLLADVADQLAITCGGTEQWRSGGSFGLDVKENFKASKGFVRTRSAFTLSSGSSPYHNHAVAAVGSLYITVASGSVSLTGIAFPSVQDGQVLHIVKRGAGTLIFEWNDAGSSAANRWGTEDGNDLSVGAGSAVLEAVYETNIWVVRRLA